MKQLDNWLDNVTIYRLVLYYLGGLLVAAVVLSATGALHYSPVWLIVETVILLVACWIINKILAWIFTAPVNPESSLITALILALLITPFQAPGDKGVWLLFLLAASGLAMASKYVLTIKGKHIFFNPAAIAVVLTGIGAQQTASWWIGNAVLLPFVLIGGILLVRKLRLAQMVTVYAIASLVATVIYTFIGGGNVVHSLRDAILSSPLFFLGFVMLTEPQTLAPRPSSRAWYAILVGVLLPPQVHFLRFYSSPELALIIGNIFAHITSPKIKLFPVLKQKLRLSANAIEFVFNPGQKLAYQPGQYMEWTLPHHKTDSRGSRRYFTLSSSPTEPEIRIGVKFYDKGSSFKKALLEMDKAKPIVAAQISGDFTLPADKSQKLAFVAGGIGVTPFRSMVKYLLDTGDKRSIAMLYAVQSSKDLAYRELLEEARAKMGLNLTYFVANGQKANTNTRTKAGTITTDAIKYEVPDYKERVFYISGTHSTVTAVKAALRSLGVPTHQIKIDFFPGYA